MEFIVITVSVAAGVGVAKLRLQGRGANIVVPLAATLLWPIVTFLALAPKGGGSRVGVVSTLEEAAREVSAAPNRIAGEFLSVVDAFFMALLAFAVIGGTVMTCRVLWPNNKEVTG